MKSSKSIIVLLTWVLIALSSCGGSKPSPTPAPNPEPTPGGKTEEPKAPEWNKDRTLSFLVVAPLGQARLGSSREAATALLDELRKTDASATSAYLLMGFDLSSAGDKSGTESSLIADGLKCFPIVNVATPQKGNILLIREWAPTFRSEPLSSQGSFLTTVSVGLEAMTEKHLKYNLPLGIVTLESDSDVSALNKLLTIHTKFPSSIVVIGSATKSLVNKISDISGYEKAVIEYSDSVVLFLIAPKSYMLRSYDSVFTLGGGVGLRLQVEAGVDR